MSVTCGNHGNTCRNHVNWLQWFWQLTLLWVTPPLIHRHLSNIHTNTHRHTSTQFRCSLGEGRNWKNRALILRKQWRKREERERKGEGKRQAQEGTCRGVTDTAFLIFKQKEMLWMFHALLNKSCPMCGVSAHACVSRACFCTRHTSLFKESDNCHTDASALYACSTLNTYKRNMKKPAQLGKNQNLWQGREKKKAQVVAVVPNQPPGCEAGLRAVCCDVNKAQRVGCDSKWKEMTAEEIGN